uniref:Uncharacterized protein n=1 Tax=Cacopsylla melanoneura TaxID=428564 RepID=A0A8D8UAB7_9HEMI
MIDDLVIVRQVQLDSIDRLVERPGMLMFPHRTENVLRNEVQLVCVPSRSVRGRLDRWLDNAVDRIQSGLVPSWWLPAIAQTRLHIHFPGRFNSASSRNPLHAK